MDVIRERDGLPTHTSIGIASSYMIASQQEGICIILYGNFIRHA